MPYIQTKSMVRNPKSNLITIEEDKVADDGTVIKTKKYQMKLSDFNPRTLFDARKKHFG